MGTCEGVLNLRLCISFSVTQCKKQRLCVCCMPPCCPGRRKAILFGIHVFKMVLSARIWTGSIVV
jgi:hypothetical protein